MVKPSGTDTTVSSSVSRKIPTPPPNRGRLKVTIPVTGVPPLAGLGENESVMSIGRCWSTYSLSVPRLVECNWSAILHSHSHRDIPAAAEGGSGAVTVDPVEDPTTRPQAS